jgi:hypothetical protein
MKSDQTAAYQTVHCSRHGDNREAFMCKHLLQGAGLGFFYDVDDPANPYPDAWCPVCEQSRDESGEFPSEYARANFKLVCGACYEEIKQKNITGPKQPARVH